MVFVHDPMTQSKYVDREPNKSTEIYQNEINKMVFIHDSMTQSKYVDRESNKSTEIYQNVEDFP